MLRTKIGRKFLASIDGIKEVKRKWAEYITGK